MVCFDVKIGVEQIWVAKVNHFVRKGWALKRGTYLSLWRPRSQGKDGLISGVHLDDGVDYPLFAGYCRYYSTTLAVVQRRDVPHGSLIDVWGVVSVVTACSTLIARWVWTPMPRSGIQMDVSIPGREDYLWH